jgi:hypothetical protein
MGWRRGFVAALAAFVLGTSVPAAADITVVGKYTFVNGDTATRASYYSRKRTRVTSPSGMEFIHDTQARRVTVIDHAQRRYYQGTIEEADSIASRILLQRREELRPLIEANREMWAQRMMGFNDSIRVIETDESRTIAGYPATRWMMLAGQYMTHERWVARGLSVPNFGPELEKVMMAPVLDPLGRQLMKMLIQMRENPGTVLKSSTQFRTPTQSGSFSWEAIRVGSEKIPGSAWSPPPGYTKAKPGAR